MKRRSFIDKLLEATVPTSPETQGSLEATCGIYAISNALSLLNIEGFDSTKCFMVACSAIRDKFPGVLWKGTYISDMETMAAACCNWIEREYGAKIQCTRPFLDTDFRTAGEFYTALGKELDDYSVATLGIDEPYQHWTVAWYAEAGKIRFFDSDGLTLVRQKDISIEERDNKWTFATDETLIFRKISD